MQVVNNGVRREIALCEQHAAELQARAGVSGSFQPGPFKSADAPDGGAAAESATPT